MIPTREKSFGSGNRILFKLSTWSKFLDEINLFGNFSPRNSQTFKFLSWNFPHYKIVWYYHNISIVHIEISTINCHHHLRDKSFIKAKKQTHTIGGYTYQLQWHFQNQLTREIWKLFYFLSKKEVKRLSKTYINR